VLGDPEVDPHGDPIPSDALEPIETGHEVSDATGVRSDYLLEYADGRRAPTAARTSTLLGELDPDAGVRNIERIQAGLRDAIESLGVPYAHLAEGTPYLGTDFINLLEHDDHDLGSLPRFRTLAREVRSCAAGMLSSEVLAYLRELVPHPQLPGPLGDLRPSLRVECDVDRQYSDLVGHTGNGP
jgi:hypothetical protein